MVSLFTVSHGAGGNETLTLYSVPPGGTPSASNALLYQVNVASNSYFEIREGWVIPPGNSVQMQSSPATTVVMNISGQLIGQ